MRNRGYGGLKQLRCSGEWIGSHLGSIYLPVFFLLNEVYLGHILEISFLSKLGGKDGLLAQYWGHELVRET
jgi:hypothetical protein